MYNSKKNGFMGVFLAIAFHLLKLLKSHLDIAAVGIIFNIFSYDAVLSRDSNDEQMENYWKDKKIK